MRTRVKGRSRVATALGARMCQGTLNEVCNVVTYKINPPGDARSRKRKMSNTFKKHGTKSHHTNQNERR